MVQGKATKPAIIIDSHYQVWLGNVNDTELEVTAGDLFGFGTGTYGEQALVRCWTCLD